MLNIHKTYQPIQFEVHSAVQNAHVVAASSHQLSVGISSPPLTSAPVPPLLLASGSCSPTPFLSDRSTYFSSEPPFHVGSSCVWMIPVWHRAPRFLSQRPSFQPRSSPRATSQRPPAPEWRLKFCHNSRTGMVRRGILTTVCAL